MKGDRRRQAVWVTEAKPARSIAQTKVTTATDPDEDGTNFFWMNGLHELDTPTLIVVELDDSLHMNWNLVTEEEYDAGT